MSLLRAALLAGLLAGCENVHAEVACKPTSEASIVCTVHQDQGKTEMEVCWDLSVDCGGGVVVTTPRSCAKVEDGGTSEVTIPKDKLTNLDKCVGPAPKMALSNLTINGKTPDSK